MSWPTLYLLDAKGVVRYKGGTLRSVGVRDGKDGRPEPFGYSDEVVDALAAELGARP